MKMPTLEKLPASSSTEDILAILKRDGAVILTDVLSAGEVAAMRKELEPFVEATPLGTDSFTGNRTTRTGGLVARTEKARDLVMHQTVIDAANAFLKPYCEKIQLHLTQIIRIMPGQTAQALHRDRWAWGTHLAHVEPQFNTIWALTDFTKENGATRVCPGSLNWPDNHEPTEDQIGYAEMKAGSVLLYSGSVFHSGGANVSDGERWAYNITYTLGWLRQEENQYLSCPPEFAKNLPKAMQELIGYSMGGYALGYFTPPLPAGQGPEAVPPEYALGAEATTGTLGNADLLASISSEVRGEKVASL
tara:strand:- start:149 stop:1063 length:915 start_codon:yes stop_codon:yes gene_type:complete